MRQRTERHWNPRRSGAAVVAMVVVLGGIAIALLILAGKTSIQSKSNQKTALETQQCNELIELGGEILAKRLESTAAYSGETIRLNVPFSLVAGSNVSPQLGIIELKILTKTDQEAKQSWSIVAYLGASERSLRQASKTLYLDTAPNPKNENE